MTLMIKRFSISILILFASALCACSTPDAVYQKPASIPDGHALVYIYRPGKFYGFGVAPNLYTRQGQQFINKIDNGGYLTFLLKPGRIDFSAVTETESSVSFDVLAGQIYYIRLTISAGAITGRPHLEIVSAEMGEKEILNCKPIPERQK